MDNIIKNRTLETYNYKYRNCRERLLKISKKEVEKYDSNKEGKNNLLKGNKWCLINDTYYQIPKTFSWTWFRNLHAACQIGTCVILGGAVVTAVAVPTYLAIKANEVNASILENISNIRIKEKKLVNGNAEITLECLESDKEITSISVIIEQYMLKNNEFSVDLDTYKLTIYKETLQAHRGKMIIIPNVENIVADFATCSWNFISNACKKLENKEITEEDFCKKFKYESKKIATLSDFVGKERIVNVNDVDHRVRIIGINHDKDVNDKELTFTFEFANLLSDSNGNSLAYQYNDVNDIYKVNVDYLNSSLRFALNGTGNNAGKQDIEEKKNQVLTGQKEGIKWSNSYMNKTVISMLPEDLVSNIRTTKKYVGTKVDSTFVDTMYEDKLFILSGKEIGWKIDTDHGCGTIYNYYVGHETQENDPYKVMKQINNEEFTYPTTISSTEGQVALKDIDNYAGFNYDVKANQGGRRWLNSPVADQSSLIVSHYGDRFSCFGDQAALAIAPAFCI